MTRPPRIDLGSTPDFRLGSLWVQPSLRQIITAAGEAFTIEPRVMQVLVALANATGDVVTRDELVLRCWNGVVVGDGAIHRVVSLVRRLAVDVGEGSFVIETVPRVGYRLVETRPHDSASETDPKPDVPDPLPEAPAVAPTDPATFDAGPRIGRRGLVAAMATATTGAAGAAILLNRPKPRSNGSAADALTDRSEFSMRLQGERSAIQSIRYMERAVEVDPQSARAWGGLALAYSLAMIDADDTHLQGLAMRCRAAATRALELEPGNVDAQVALVNYPGPFGRWAAMQREIETVLKKVGAHPLPIAGLAAVMIQTGRWSDALSQWDRLIASDPLIPVAYAERARTLWSLGRLLEAEQALTEASKTLPPHPGVLHAQFDLQLFSGRPEEARRALDAMIGIGGATPLQGEIGKRLVEAAGAGQQAMPPEVAGMLIAECRPDGIRANIAARYLAAFGEIDSAFQLLSSFYFGGVLPSGVRLPPPPQYARRKTDDLFMPTMAGLRARPEFARMTGRLGLDAYWQQTGTQPQLPSTSMRSGR